MAKKKNKAKINYEQAFADYVTWKSLPSIFRGKTTDELVKHGIHDPVMHEILSFRTQGEFEKRFKINKNTLTNWNNRIEEEDLVRKARKKWMKGLASNVMGAFYRATMQEGDAPRVKLFLQYTDDFVDTTVVRSPELEKLGKAIMAIAEKKR